MEQVLIERQGNTCIIYNKQLGYKLGERDIDTISQIIPSIDEQMDDTTHTYDMSNDDLRAIGLNARPMKTPVQPFAMRNK
ncbi:hypothetical protein CD144_00430 [Staphylococcus equorum subsp. linens]|uniref:hypothetical protein n=1 Tax=Staphylococcus equorum TaxID=246432 RepID=UPI000CD151EF|nr:hypothetical protein [Staphylococcus equorum]PNZ09533.1 hypothetical protein CD144_00430 [Staphylococcus equorum subsp. linens]QQT19221.1 hypothetical protein I6J07_13750 [Staphylococcus equorum]